MPYDAPNGETNGVLHKSIYNSPAIGEVQALPVENPFKKYYIIIFEPQSD